jgi:hypothetical protein
MCTEEPARSGALSRRLLASIPLLGKSYEAAGRGLLEARPFLVEEDDLVEREQRRRCLQ